jgi:two-component sensor histidine kinase
MRPRPAVKSSVPIPPAQSILDALTVAVALLDENGTIVAVNEGWCAFARANGADRPDHFIGSNYLDQCDHVPGIEGGSARAAAGGIRAVLAGEGEFSLEYPCHSPVEKRWFQLRVSRLEHCGAVFAVVAHHNITKRILAEQERQALLAKAQQTAERQQLLIRELHHRVRNTLATVQGLLGATARSTTSVDEFYRSFAGRIASLGKMHTMLTEDYWQRASLEEILRNELAPYDQGPEPRVVLEGPPLELSADLAVPMGMALHELTTNAVKHGALSVPAGRVRVVWDVVHEGGQRKLDLEWTECGGPPVRQPRRTGFGSILLKRVLPAQCDAAVEFELAKAGVRFRMRAPLVEHRLVPEY